MLMTKAVLKDLCKQNSLYRTPGLNDKLYCNFKGFAAISDMEEYVNVRALFLEGNVLESLEGLPPLEQLRCLYVQQNCLRHLESGLDGLDNLDTLNVSNNQLAALDGLEACPTLQTLLATHNMLDSADSLKALASLPKLTTLDLQNNKIEEPAALEVMYAMPELRCLYLKGNPVVSTMKNYRKTLISKIAQLTYLDDRPVSETERRCTVAWASGGVEAEREERRKCKEEEEEVNRKNFEFMQKLRQEGWKERRKRLGLPDGDTDPALEDMGDEEYEFEVEPPELVEARRQLAAYTSRAGEEEAPEITEARRQLVKDGGSVQEGSWSQGTTTAQQDGEIYLASVKQNQAELCSGIAGAAAAAGVNAAAGDVDMDAAAGQNLGLTGTTAVKPDAATGKASHSRQLAKAAVTEHMLAPGSTCSSEAGEQCMDASYASSHVASPACSTDGRDPTGAGATAAAPASNSLGNADGSSAARTIDNQGAPPPSQLNPLFSHTISDGEQSDGQAAVDFDELD